MLCEYVNSRDYCHTNYNSVSMLIVFKVSKSRLKDFYSLVNTFILFPKFRNGRLVVQKQLWKHVLRYWTETGIDNLRIMYVTGNVTNWITKLGTYNVLPDGIVSQLYYNISILKCILIISIRILKILIYYQFLYRHDAT